MDITGRGERLKKFLKHEKLTLKTIAEELKIPGPTLYSIVNRDITSSTALSKVVDAVSVYTDTPSLLLYLYLEDFISFEALLASRDFKGILNFLNETIDFNAEDLDYSGYNCTSTFLSDCYEAIGLVFLNTKLNDNGRKEALKRVGELCMISKYQK